MIVSHDEIRGPNLDETVELIHAAYVAWAQARDDQIEAVRAWNRDVGSPLAFR